MMRVSQTPEAIKINDEVRGLDTEHTEWNVEPDFFKDALIEGRDKNFKYSSNLLTDMKIGFPPHLDKIKIYLKGDIKNMDCYLKLVYKYFGNLTNADKNYAERLQN